MAAVILSRDNPFNATIHPQSVPNSDPLYTVDTRPRGDQFMHTVIYRGARRHGNGQIIAQLYHASGDITDGDMVQLAGKEPMEMSSWLKFSLNPFKDTRTFEDSNTKRKYQWMRCTNDKFMELRCKTSNELLMTFERICSNPENRHERQILLTLTPHALQLGIQDLAIISFLLLEGQRRRMSTALERKIQEQLVMSPLVRTDAESDRSRDRRHHQHHNATRTSRVPSRASR